MKPAVSVIIPVYKVEQYLPACLDSLLGQTFTDWEAICVNDGSPDNCGQILAEYAKRDKRIKVLTQENQGLSMARNNGLKAASGEYVFFFDSDDCIHPQLLEICYTLAQKENADMVSFSMQTGTEPNLFGHYGISDVKYKKTTEPLYHQKKRCKWKVSVNAWTKLYKKFLLENLAFISGITYEDYPHTYTILAQNPKSVLLDLPLYFYRQNPKSISHVDFTVKNIKDYHTGLNSIIEVYEQTSKKAKRFVLRELFPNILKQELNKIQRSSVEAQKDLYAAFSVELKDLYEKGWLKPWGHKIGRYLTYRKLIRKGTK